jgi:sn-glycerol 3-phosphate transport system ATP-binding protein
LILAPAQIQWRRSRSGLKITAKPGGNEGLSAISLRNVVKAWGETRAVDGVSFEAAAGSLVVLLGPSGCGKSTTLRLIAGLEEVTSGRVWIGNADVTDLAPSQRRVSMVFQSYALFPHLTVAENVVFGLEVRGVPAGRARDAPGARGGAARPAEPSAAQAFAALRAGSSSGSRSVARSSPRPAVPDGRAALEPRRATAPRDAREIRALQRKLGITMVYVTHDQTEAMTMADQVILLRDGRSSRTVRPRLSTTAPATAFTARFIGTPPMNVGHAPGHAAHGLLLGVRPEDIRIGTEGLPATVENVEYLGADSIVACRAGSETLTVRLPRAAHLAPGAGVKLSWHSTAAHYFDAATGLRAEPPAARIVA